MLFLLYLIRFSLNKNCVQRAQERFWVNQMQIKNNHSLHKWSFYRLAQYIEYKVKLAGIKVEYINSTYTSQRYPVCGNVHHANDRNYTCSCGFHSHRDLLGAMNICNSTECVGDNNIRHTA